MRKATKKKNKGGKEKGKRRRINFSGRMEGREKKKT